jgi:hypothetical protein
VRAKRAFDRLIESALPLKQPAKQPPKQPAKSTARKVAPATSATRPKVT